MDLLLAKAPGITVFGFEITAYALSIVTGILTAFFLISLLFKRRNMSTDLFMTYFCICLPIALITTRLFYCITDGMPISEWFAFESIRRGGLSIIGGILGGLFSVIGVSYFKKVNFFRVGDCVVIGLMIAQAIGRWGNFFNQEVYGGVIENEALHFFPFGVYINPNGTCWDTFAITFGGAEITGGEWHYAFFLYESLANTIVAGLMFWYAWKNPYKPNGVITACYFIGYGLVRSIMEPLRSQEFILGDAVPWSLVFSLLLLAFGLAMLAFVLVWNKKKEGKLFGSATGDPYGITKFIKDVKDEKAYFSKWNMMCAIYPENYEIKPPKEKKEKTELTEKKEKENPTIDQGEEK
ncbi:MAG: prolipoprotein diacylglyceryl transferase [Clostridia bacterium]|nr:prolipoprotein diacylglyceryl transferase [Clostridia bacterium]